MDWIKTIDRKPEGKWGPNHPHLSEEVLVVNTCSTNIAFYNRDDGNWYVDYPDKEELIDKITHWMPLPKSPHFSSVQFPCECPSGVMNILQEIK